MATIDARPHPLSIDPHTTAVIVVDMQNDFGAEGGMFARAGRDISGIRAAVEPTARILGIARRAGIPIVYLKMGFAPDLSDAGGPDAPSFVRHRHVFNVGDAVTAPDGRPSRILVRDTWNTDILDEFTPQAGDRIVDKYRFSAFFETNLDATLKKLGAASLVFTGCTTSVCVESTLRDAYFRDYRCLLLADCTAEPIGEGLPRSNHEATLFLVERLFGWVSDSTAFARALAAEPAVATAG